MSENIKKGDFIEIEYTARLAEDNVVFDTTSEEVAKNEHVHLHKAFKPVVVCVGEGQVLPGLDKRLTGASLGKHTFALPAEEAFGKKSAKLLQLIPRKVFKEQNVQPVPGLEINVDNQVGIIRSVGGGRIIVDFNHPLASRDVVYEVEVKRIVTDQAEQIKSVLTLMGFPFKEVTVADGKAVVSGVQELPPQLVEVFSKDLVRLTKVADVTFVAEKKAAEKENNKV